jgi:hypothetical protein
MLTSLDERRQPRLWRSRWAAIGAAVAVTLGAGGLLTANAASDPSVFVAIEPVRVLDTRSGVGLSGTFTSESPRDLTVTGIVPAVVGDTVVPTEVVPAGATAIVANVTAVRPSTAGFVAVRPATATGDPTTSNVNFTTGGVVVPNSVTVEVPTTGPDAGDIELWFKGTGPTATTHLLLDIVGYYEAGGTGPKGDTGDPGPKGDTGAQGAKGDSCSVGRDGDIITIACEDGSSESFALDDTMLVCGGSSRDASAFLPAGAGMAVVSGCSPDSGTQAVLVTRSGTGLFDATELTDYVTGGGIVITEHSASDEVFSAIFEPVSQGAFFSGGCSDNVMPFAQSDPGDPVWSAVPFVSDGTGCGYDLGAYPGITALGEHSGGATSLAYRDLGAGRVWLVEADWQDTQAGFTEGSRALMEYFITHRS